MVGGKVLGDAVGGLAVAVVWGADVTFIVPGVGACGLVAAK